MNYRRRKRSFQHEEAHSEDPAASQPPLAHELVPTGEPLMITTDQGLADYLAELRDASIVAYDTEFIGEETYHPHICLVQLATTDSIALIDPLTISSLDPVWELLADPGVTKLVHAGQVDLKHVHHGIGVPAASVIDTQIAAAFAGLPWPVGLARVIESFTGHRLGKGHTFTNWDARPLSAQQLHYAADDVRYLPMLWSMLEEELTRRGTLDWALRECENTLRRDMTFDPEPHLRKICKGMRLKPRARALLRALVIERDRVAEEADRPHRVLLPDSAMLEMTRRKPRTAADLAGIRGFPRPTAEKWHAGFLEILGRVDELDISQEKVRKPSSELASDQVEVDALWMAICTRLLAQGIAPGIVLSRGILAEWFLEQRKQGGDGLFAEDDWRREALGDWITGFLSGDNQLVVGWGDRGAIVQEHSNASRDS